jgi:hypothetical protein
LFGDEDAMNRVVKIDNKSDVKITGIYKDLPKTRRSMRLLLAPLDLYLHQMTGQAVCRRVNSGNIEVLVQLAPHAKLMTFPLR